MDKLRYKRALKPSNERSHETASHGREKELAEAALKTHELSRRVKNILDELNILDTMAHYQQDVQRAMKKHDIAEADLTSTYIINDIKRLNGVGKRVYAAVSFL